MTYKKPLPVAVLLSFFRPSFSGSPTTGDYFTLTVGSTNDLGIAGTGTSTLSLPAGTYHVRCALGGDKSSAEYIDFQWELGGTLVGNQAGWDAEISSTNKRISCEYAEAVFNVTSATNLRLKCIGHGGAVTIDGDYSGAVLKGHQ